MPKIVKPEDRMENKDSVRKYHAQIRDMKIKFVKNTEENGLPDYAEIIKNQAAKLGKTANEYILDLIQNDVRLNPDGLKIDDFVIVRSVKELK